METIRLATPGDAPLIAAAVSRCYGQSYTTPQASDPAHVAAELHGGRVVYALAFAEDGRHVGQAALFRHSNSDLWEVGRAVVDPDQRGKGLCNALSDLLICEVAPRVGARFVLGHLVTSHTFVQLHSMSRGFVPTGLLLGMAPATLCPTGIARTPQPVSIVIALKNGRAPHPERRLALREPELSRALDLYRRLEVPARAAPPTSEGELPGAVFERLPSFGIARLRFDESTPPRPLAELLAQAADDRLAWADVPVEDPRAATLIDELRRMGFSWGALIPLAGPAGEDVIRFQRLTSRVKLRAQAIHVLDELVPLRDMTLAELPGEGVTSA